MPIPGGQMAATQAHTLAENLGGDAPSSSPTAAKVIIPSELTLTPEQENRLITHCRERIQELENDLGRIDFEGADWLTAPILDIQQTAATFMGRRHLAHMVAQQRMEWRPHLLGGLYRESNLHLPLTARIITQQSARAQKSFFGTSPYFSVSGVSSEEKDFANDLQEWATHKLETESAIHADLETAIDLAFIQGECVVKTRRNKLLSYFESFREVAINQETSEPFVAMDGDYIYKTDVFVEEMITEVDETGTPLMDEAGQPRQKSTGRMLLRRDGKTPQPVDDMASTMKLVKVDLAKVLRDRIEAKPIYYLDFLCPLDATDVQSADLCCHLYNTQVIELVTKYLADAQDQSPEQQIETIRRITAELMPGTPSDKMAAGDKSRSELSEKLDSTGASRTEPAVAMAETYTWFDPFGDGVMRSLIVLMDKEGRVPLYYNYVANITDDGLRPIDVVRINPPSGRWHGMGNVERFWNLQVHTDLLINRSLYAESKAARVDFWNPHLTVEGQKNPGLRLNWGGTYTVADPQTDPSKILKPVYLENIKSQNLQQMLQIILQMAQNMSAVTNVNDGAMAGMDTAKLATGIKNLEASGEEMFHTYMAQLRRPLEEIIRRALRLVVKDIEENRPKVISFLDRNSRLVEIDPNRLRELDLNITLSLTTYRGQQELQQGQTGYTTLSSYFKEHPVVQNRLHKFVTQILRALEVKDAETISTPLTMEEWQMMLPPAPAPAGQPATNTRI